MISNKNLFRLILLNIMLCQVALTRLVFAAVDNEVNAFDNYYGSFVGGGEKINWFSAVYGVPFVIKFTNDSGIANAVLFSNAGVVGGVYEGDSLQLDGVSSDNPAVGQSCVAGGNTVCVTATGPTQNITGIVNGFIPPAVTGTPNGGVFCAGCGFGADPSITITLGIGPYLEHAVRPVFEGGLLRSLGRVLTNGEMGAEFTPNFGESLRFVASLGGFDHFNWVQLMRNIVAPPGISDVVLQDYIFRRPGVDPLPGGNLNQRITLCPADMALFYWDENASECRRAKEYAIEDHILPFANPTTLDIVDRPSLLPGMQIDFDTCLAGVKVDGTPMLFPDVAGTCFSWTYVQGSLSVIGDDYSGLTLQGDVGFDAGHFGMAMLNKILEPSDFDTARVEAFQNAGVLRFDVPEPATLSILTLGLGLFGLGMVRRNVRPKVSEWRSG